MSILLCKNLSLWRDNYRFLCRSVSLAFLAVAHKEFANFNIRNLVEKGVVYDVKGVLPKDQVDARL